MGDAWVSQANVLGRGWVWTMGGGLQFLSKKSWHPGRLKNQVRVAQAEAAEAADAEAEDRRAEARADELRSTLLSSLGPTPAGGVSSSTGVEWMYEGAGRGDAQYAGFVRSRGAAAGDAEGGGSAAGSKTAGAPVGVEVGPKEGSEPAAAAAAAAAGRAGRVGVVPSAPRGGPVPPKASFPPSKGWGEGSSNARTERWSRERDDPLVAMREAELAGLAGSGLSPAMRREAVLAREQARMERREERRAKRAAKNKGEGGDLQGGGSRKNKKRRHGEPTPPGGPM